MNLLVTGGCGYIGAPLTQTLLALGHQVTVIDAGYYGCCLAPHPQLTLRVQDLRLIEDFDLGGFEAVLAGRSIRVPGGDIATVAHAVRAAGIDAIVRLAPATLDETMVELSR